jgi:hypothetical protein
MASAKSVIETSTNIALLTVCCLLGWLFVSHRDLWLHGKAQTPSDSSLMGEVLTQLPEYDWKSHEMTLVMAMRSDCHFCQVSMPFYKHLAELQADNQFRAHLLAVMPDTRAANPLQSGGINVQGVYELPLNSIHVSGTPTLLLVNASGRVDQAWVGLLTPAQEKDVITVLESNPNRR